MKSHTGSSSPSLSTPSRLRACSRSTINSTALASSGGHYIGTVVKDHAESERYEHPCGCQVRRRDGVERIVGKPQGNFSTQLTAIRRQELNVEYGDGLSA